MLMWAAGLVPMFFGGVTLANKSRRTGAHAEEEEGERRGEDDHAAARPCPAARPLVCPLSIDSSNGHACLSACVCVRVRSALPSFAKTNWRIKAVGSSGRKQRRTRTISDSRMYTYAQ